MKYKTDHWKYLDLFASLFIACLLAANIVSVKMFQIGSFVLPAGTIIFPISYIVNDILSEVYGFRNAHRIIWLGFLANLLLVASILIAQQLPGATIWDAQAAYERILGFTPRLLIASFSAYILGSITNAWVMVKMKALTQGRWLWTRTIGSTLIGEGLDSLIFMFIAFSGKIPTIHLIETVMHLWVAKTFYEVLVTPLTYLIINKVKCIEGIDTDRTTLREVSLDNRIQTNF